ncbi:epoxide hydrolase 4 isoform X1 [Xiphophorus couchianus]|uniref:epoxide hydrolase 4 isoform X1 n=1 Tax=Xiphophorus couchianus TaxID=32473 RepID=UPI00101678A7|nr:epoxide hydrolase 4 isoform X1 [Xiphophorus couchianus]
MARVLNNLLLFLIRLALKIRVWGYWTLIYGYCALCTTAALLKLCWNIVLRPTTTFQWGIRETPPACLNDTSLGTHCYVRIKESGLRFHYVAAGERGKPLMLFLHGFPEFWFSWRYQLREFKSEFRVVAVDMRGYGESDLPLSTENYQLDHLVTDVKDIVEYLGYNRCCLVGHDWGGSIAWLFAIHYPEMVTKLIVLNCPHPSVFTAAPLPRAHALHQRLQGPQSLVHQSEHRDREKGPMAHCRGLGSLLVCTLTAGSSDRSSQLLQECLQLAPSEPQARQVSGAAAVGRAGRIPGAGDGRGVPPLHQESLPSQYHIRGQPLAAAGPARHCQHPHMDLPEGGRGTQKLQELNPHRTAPPPNTHLAPSPLSRKP